MPGGAVRQTAGSPDGRDCRKSWRAGHTRRTRGPARTHHATGSPRCGNRWSDYVRPLAGGGELADLGVACAGPAARHRPRTPGCPGAASAAAGRSPTAPRRPAGRRRRRRTPPAAGTSTGTPRTGGAIAADRLPTARRRRSGAPGRPRRPGATQRVEPVGEPAEQALDRGPGEVGRGRCWPGVRPCSAPVASGGSGCARPPGRAPGPGRRRPAGADSASRTSSSWSTPSSRAAASSTRAALSVHDQRQEAAGARRRSRRPCRWRRPPATRATREHDAGGADRDDDVARLGADARARRRRCRPCPGRARRRRREVARRLGRAEHPGHAAASRPSASSSRSRR